MPSQMSVATSYWLARLDVVAPSIVSDPFPSIVTAFALASIFLMLTLMPVFDAAAEVALRAVRVQPGSGAVGGAGGRISGGRNLDYRKNPNRQMCRLYLTMMEKMGIRKSEFGDATEPLDEI